MRARPRSTAGAGALVADRYAATKQREIAADEQETVRDIRKLFSELQTYRNIHAGQWEEAAALVLPTSKNTFFYGSYNFPGEKKTQQQIDATGALALSQFCAIADSMVTPKNWKWHGLKSYADVMKDRKCRTYFDAVRDALFDYRYRPEANFHGQNFNNWQSLGAFGNSVMFTDRFDARWNHGAPGLRYKSVPLGECFFGENHQGVVTTMVRWFRKTAEQAVEAFGIEWLPASMRPALEQNLQTPFSFLHCVRPRDPKKFDPRRLDAKGKPFQSVYISIEGNCLMADEGGYRTFPYAVSRYDQTPGEVYGRGPAQIVLPGLKTLNAEKAMFLKTGHLAGDPVLLTADDGITNFSRRPGAMNPGSVNADGKPLVHALPVGDLQITKEMMDEERGVIETVFLTSLFKVLTQHPDMTATQVIELLNERGMLVAPTLGRQHNEYVGSLVPREIDLLQEMTDVRGRPVLPPMPDLLREYGGYYDIEDTSPLAMAARTSEVAGFSRWADQLHQWAAISGDMSILDPLNFDKASRGGAEIMNIRTDWISDDREIALKRQNRAKAQANQTAIQALPAQAAMKKADAALMKAGVPQGGQQQMPA